MSRKKIALTPEAWSASVGLDLANKVINTLLKHKEEAADEDYRFAVSMFLTGIIASYVAVTLREEPKGAAKMSKREQAAFAENNFKEIKAMLQKVVADGVSNGVLNWSGQDIEYYCLIKMTPDPVNGRPC